jgi:hypothetical protein
MKTIMMVTMLLLAATSMNAQDSTEGTRRNRVRLQGGVVTDSNFEIPLVNLNWHHRFFDSEKDLRIGPSMEVGLHWIIPYADVGVEVASRDFSLRAGGGVLVVPYFSGDAVYYWTGLATFVVARGDWVDLELEGRVLAANSGSSIGVLTASLAIH